jgi:acetyl-CoA acyltransferase
LLRSATSKVEPTPDRLCTSSGTNSAPPLGIPDDAPHLNPNGGAIAFGHPLGVSGGRLVATAAYELARTNGRFALRTMCIGVGQGIAMIIDRAKLPISLSPVA